MRNGDPVLLLPNTGNDQPAFDHDAQPTHIVQAGPWAAAVANDEDDPLAEIRFARVMAISVLASLAVWGVAIVMALAWMR